MDECQVVPGTPSKKRCIHHRRPSRWKKERRNKFECDAMILDFDMHKFNLECGF